MMMIRIPLSAILVLAFGLTLVPRGDAQAAPGMCPCAGSSSHGQFVKCVRIAIKKLPKSERKAPEVKALKRAAARSSCGKPSVSKKSIACCLPRNSVDDIVTEGLCVAVRDKQCAGAGGTSKGPSSSCLPTNPCSPSGAFLDDAGF